MYISYRGRKDEVDLHRAQLLSRGITEHGTHHVAERRCVNNGDGDGEPGGSGVLQDGLAAFVFR